MEPGQPIQQTRLMCVKTYLIIVTESTHAQLCNEEQLDQGTLRAVTPVLGLQEH